MSFTHHKKQTIFIIALLVFALTWTACGRGQNAVDGKAPEAVQMTGVGAENLSSYAAAFDVTFAPDDDPSGGWSYSVDMLVIENPPARQQVLVIDGLGQDKDPGDTTLIQVGDAQYMTGEGVGPAGCLVFPASVDLSESYLMPGDFLPASDLNKLDRIGDVEIAGTEGKRFAFKADEVSGFTNVEGEIVQAKDGDYLLLYALTGHTLDTYFGDGAPGTIAWHYEVTDLVPSEAPAVPLECEATLPIMADAQELTRLPGLLKYTSPTAAEEVVAFYQRELEAAGWLVYNLPAVSDDTTLLLYAREGELLNVSISVTAGGTEVQIFLEDRPE
ncbi:MAG: hypothetical protein JXB30_04230 [Anaerolineae bacterium]|nr:hypothetical protein [Anaerolineae bacterium]